MSIKLNRFKLLLLGLSLIVLLYFGGKNYTKQQSSIVVGVVVMPEEYELYESQYPPPVLRYWVQNQSYIYHGLAHQFFKLGEKVEVIFPKGKPNNSRIYSFKDFWLGSAIYWIVPLMIVEAFILAVFQSNEGIQISLFPFQMSQLNNRKPLDLP